jgi:hypothetical protein
VQNVEQHHRIEPAAHGDQDGVVFEGKKGVLLNEAANDIEHKIAKQLPGARQYLAGGWE